ncbi:MAG TPA: NAD-binding protein [Mycobacteriales bacterium]|nr:NAD-binding protein [Mycobacteriales bacterium]
MPTGSTVEGAVRVRPPDPSTTDKLKYRFDALLSRGPMGVILLLLVITLAFVAASAAVMSLAHQEFGGTHKGFGEDFWQSMLRVLDSGTFASDTNWAVRAIALVVTLSGIFIASALIGIIATGFEQRIEALQRGRGAVIESGHTLVLGRSPRLYAVISELVIANESERKPAIVVLSTSEKSEIEDEVDARVDDLKNTRLIFRTGDPANPATLEKVAIATARSVVVLADEEGDGDAGAVKAALAANAMLPDGDAPIVVELSSESTAAALKAACGDRVLPVQAADIIAKVVAQACRQAGLGAVYRELLDFDGDEIYTAAATDVVGRRFGEILLAYDGCTVLGLQHRDGSISLCPSMDLQVAEGDRLFLVAEDDSAVSFSGIPDVAPAPARNGETAAPPDADRLLVIGWSDLGGRIIAALDGMLPPGADLRIVVDAEVVDPSAVVVPPTSHQVTVAADTGVADLGVENYDQIFVLGYRGHLSQSEADARTLLTIITLNRALSSAADRPRLVAEVLESRTVPIAATAGIDDFVVSDDLGSLLMAQLSENPRLADVFGELFGANGPTITMEPAGAYVGYGSHSWGSVVLAVAARGEIALGYRQVDQPVVVNPAGSEAVELGEDDQIVVLTRNPL